MDRARMDTWTTARVLYKENERIAHNERTMSFDREVSFSRDLAASDSLSCAMGCPEIAIGHARQRAKD